METTTKLLRPDLAKTFVHAYEYKGHEIQVYLIRIERNFRPRGKRKPVKVIEVHAVSYVKVGRLTQKGQDATTYYEDGVAGFDSNHGRYKNNDESQYLHISSAMIEAEVFIDQLVNDM